MSGFAQYGNFWNYYEFNKVDERLRFLDEEQVAAIFHQKTDHDNINIMDIGCNEGNLTLAVEQILHCSLPSKTIHFLAIDIDHELIKRANNKKTETNSQIQFFSDDVVKSNIPNEFLQSHGAERFDLIFILSTTMWIHLNNGDAGLMNFLERLATLTDNLIIEPQPWKSYLSMKKRTKKLQHLLPYSLSDLKIRNNIVEEIEAKLVQCGFKLVKELGITTWERKVLWFTKDFK